MDSFIKKHFEQSAAYWFEENKKYNQMRERGIYNEEQGKRILFYEYMTFSLSRGYLEELKICMNLYKTDYEGFRIKGSQKPKNGGGYWPNFYTIMKILVAGEENLGPQEKIVNLKFAPTVDTSYLKEGFLVVEKCKRTKPKIYEIKTNEKGLKVYPYIWIEEIYCFEPDPPLLEAD